MKITRTDSGLLHSWMYIISENQHAIVIDPCRCIEDSSKYIVDMIILTHEHYDHISGANLWKKITNAPLICSVACSENIIDSKKNMARYFEVYCTIQNWVKIKKIPDCDKEYTCKADKSFKGSESIAWQGHKIDLFEIPGHSLGSIGILIDNKEFFSGDSLMRDYEIECGFPGGSKILWEDIGKKKIEMLNKGIRVWPGHFENFVL